MFNQVALTATEFTTVAAAKLAEIVTADMLVGVLDEVVGLLPIAIPAMIAYAAVRKGIGFLSGVLHSA